MEQMDIAQELRTIRTRGAEVSSTTVLKTDTLRVVLMALKAGARLHEHHADGRLVLHVLEGEIELEVGNSKPRLSAGMLVSLEAMVPHSVAAIGDAVLLLTIAWQPAELRKTGTHRNVGYEVAPPQ